MIRDLCNSLCGISVIQQLKAKQTKRKALNICKWDIWKRCFLAEEIHFLGAAFETSLMGGFYVLKPPGKLAATMFLLLLPCRKQSKCLSKALHLIQMLKLHYRMTWGLGITGTHLPHFSD